MIEYRKFQEKISVYWLKPKHKNLIFEIMENEETAEIVNDKIICITNQYQQIHYVTDWTIAMRKLIRKNRELLQYDV